jgi:hypothetical protein
LGDETAENGLEETGIVVDEEDSDDFGVDEHRVKIIKLLRRRRRKQKFDDECSWMSTYGGGRIVHDDERKRRRGAEMHENG